VNWKQDRHSEIASNTLYVDKQRHPNVATEEIVIDGCTMTVIIRALDERILRMKVKSLYESLILVARTIKAFS